MDFFSEHPQIQISSEPPPPYPGHANEVEELRSQKQRAIDNEDFDLAKQLKAKLEVALTKLVSNDAGALCYELGGSLGFLLRLVPAVHSRDDRPMPVIVLDRRSSSSLDVSLLCTSPPHKVLIIINISVRAWVAWRGGP